VHTLFKLTCKFNVGACAVASALACLIAAANAADVNFSVNSTLGVHAISPYVYGSNSSLIVNRTLDRSGGNRLTGYNWETNASNAGADWYHHSDYHLTGGQANQPPGAAVSGMIQSAATNGRGALITVPMAGYVSADASGTVDETQIAPSSRWKEIVAKKNSIYPGSPLSTNPNKTDNYVFTDEFVNWAETTKQAGQPVWYSLDNEPGLWGDVLPVGWQSGVPPNPCCNPANGTNPSSGGRTHPTIHPYAPTFAEMRSKTIAHASAIKDVNPNTLVFGGVGYGWNEFTTLQGAPGAVTNPPHPGGDQTGEMHYNEWLLQQVRNEEIVQGRKLMDVLDLHWYPEAYGGGVRITGSETTTAVVNARVQAPRSLWDPTYGYHASNPVLGENSWISQSSTQGPIKLLPRVQRDIDDFNPGTKIAITEYNYGGGNHTSGGIAQADVLGILGREGVFAAAWWDVGNGSSYVNAAFNMYRNYDGTGGKFGDTSVQATTSNITNSAVYASVDANNPNRIVLVAINRTTQPLDAAIAIADDNRFVLARVYKLTSATAAPVRGTDLLVNAGNQFNYLMPAMSVTTLVLTTLLGDYNADGAVSAADYVLWRNNFGSGAALPNGDDTPGVGMDDFARWRSRFGQSASGLGAGLDEAAGVPEPTSLLLLFVGAIGLQLCRPRGSKK
jgi:hypothetical protein